MLRHVQTNRSLHLRFRRFKKRQEAHDLCYRSPAPCIIIPLLPLSVQAFRKVFLEVRKSIEAAGPGDESARDL